MAITVFDPKTKKQFDVTPDVLPHALSDGAKPIGAVDVYDPKTTKTYSVEPDVLSSALADGATLVGSRAHAVKTTGKLESFARGAAQGASFGFADEIAGGVKSLFSDQTYQQARDEFRANDEIAQEANPKTSFAGNVGGGIASAFLPGIGQVGALKSGATLGQALRAGAEVGALTGLGSSKADLTEGNVADAAWDTAKGGLTGAAVGGGLHAVGKVAHAVKDTVTSGVKGAFDPKDQLSLALGAKRKQFSDPIVSDKWDRSLDIQNKLGLFETAAGKSLPPNRIELVDRLIGSADEAGEQLQAVFQQHGAGAAPVDEIAMQLEAELSSVIDRANPLTAAAGESAKQSLLKKLEGADDLASLWELKKDIGKWVGKGWDKDTPAAAMQVYKHANTYLDNALEHLTNQAAEEVGGAAGNALRSANEKYMSAKTLLDTLQDQVGADKWQAIVAGTRWRDWVAGNAAGSAVAGMTGEPAMYGVANIAGALGNAAIRSPQVRIMRAKIGESVQASMAERAAAMGAAPRTSQSVQQLVQQFLPQVAPTLPPQVAQRLQEIASAQPDQAAQLIRSFVGDTANRALVDMLVPRLSPSKYRTEIDGHVLAPEDKERLAKDIRGLGYDSITEAQMVSNAHKVGRVPPELYAPSQGVPKAPDYGDIVSSFND